MSRDAARHAQRTPLESVTAFRWFIDYGARPGTGWLSWAIDEMPGSGSEVAQRAFAAAQTDFLRRHL